MSGQGTEERRAIAGMGRVLGPDVLAAVQSLYAPVQRAAAMPPAAADLAYGDDPRHRLDLYAPMEADGPVPVLLWVHGGGFVRGDKHAPDGLYNAHVGRWAARHGMVGAVMNHRLAPAHGWPAGGEDVGLALDWLAAHAADHGGDPARIVVAGTSAGAVHIAAHLRLRPDRPGCRGAALLSGLYGFTALEERDTTYYGDAAAYPDRWPREAVTDTTLPLLLACAEHDPPRFQAEWRGLVAARLDRHGVLPRALVVGGHNHFSLACHIGGADRRLADDLRAFVDSVTDQQDATA